MSTVAEPAKRKSPPRPPRDEGKPILVHALSPPTWAAVPVASAEGPLAGPRWVSAPPPRYHLAPAVEVVEAPQARAAPAPNSKVRCPRCRATFEWATSRPVTVVCPHCNARGQLK